MIRKFALIFGIVYGLVGLLGFIPALSTAPEQTPGLVSEMAHGRLLGMFPVNIWHNLFHLAVGIWGISASRGFDASVNFARTTAVLFAILAILGLIPATNTLFGIMPLHSHDIWLHALTAAVTGYFGFVLPSRQVEIR